jgi:vacuolar iron transporter family protein
MVTAAKTKLLKHKTHPPHGNGGKLADIILGGQDGVVNTLGLLLGLAAATTDSKIIIAGGLAATAAETLSMAAVAYTSKMAERDHYLAERQRESSEVDEFPKIEEAEVREIYASRGLKGKLLEDMVGHVTANKERWVDMMMRDELNLIPVSIPDVREFAITVSISTLIGALIPVAPFIFLDVKTAIIASLTVSAVTLAAVGVYKARAMLGNPFKSATQMVLIGMSAAVAGYLVGHFIKG